MNYKQIMKLGKEMNKLNVVKEIKNSVIHIQFENAQYMHKSADGVGSDVYSALDDALFNLPNHAPDELTQALEQLMQEYSGSNNYVVLPQIYCKISGSTASWSIDYKEIHAAELREAEVMQNWKDEETIIDGSVLDLDDEQYSVIPGSVRKEIQDEIDNCEFYCYVVFDYQKLFDILLSYEKGE